MIWQSGRDAGCIVLHPSYCRRALRAVACVALLAASSALAQASAVALFTTDGGAPASASPSGVVAGSGVGGIRRTARADRAGLGALREAVATGRPGRLRLNLFPDVEFTASLERSAPTASGYTLSGPLQDVPFGRVVLVVNGGETRGRIYTPGANYSISTAGDVQTVERMAPAPLHCGVRDPLDAESDPDGEARSSRQFRHGPSARLPGFAPARGAEAKPGWPGAEPAAGPAPKSAAADDGDVVDVLVVYPSFVRENEGGYAQMLSLIDLDIATANEAYAASGAQLRVRLAAAEEVEYGWLREKGARNAYRLN
ncbi:MAG: hypothetical protein OXE83_01500, partial [Gammaproteobacteria bacterium]|nr:hypothetical protein [Gammaproteobacteria bacterium]